MIFKNEGESNIKRLAAEAIEQRSKPRFSVDELLEPTSRQQLAATANRYIANSNWEYYLLHLGPLKAAGFPDIQQPDSKLRLVISEGISQELAGEASWRWDETISAAAFFDRSLLTELTTAEQQKLRDRCERIWKSGSETECANVCILQGFVPENLLRERVNDLPDRDLSFSQLIDMGNDLETARLAGDLERYAALRILDRAYKPDITDDDLKVLTWYLKGHCVGEPWVRSVLALRILLSDDVYIDNAGLHIEDLPLLQRSVVKPPIRTHL